MIALRPATSVDQAFLSDLADRLADFDHPPEWRPASQIAAGDRRDMLEALMDPPPRSALVVAELDGVAAGCLHVLTKIDFFTGLPHGHISVIAVTREAEGRGVGKALMAHAEDWARSEGYDHLTLNVFPANTRARALYERHGYDLDMLSMRKGLLALVLMVLTASAAFAQRPLPAALADPVVTSTLAAIDARRNDTARWLATIGGIVSPSGREHERAAAVAVEMRRIGLSHVTVDASPNVVGRIPGRSGKALVFVSTLDDLATVAEHQQKAAAPPRVEGDRVVGPGTNTSTTTASLMAAAEALLKAGLRPEHDLVFAAVAQEETGLKGMQALYTQWKDRALAFVDVLGDGHSITYGAITIHWWKVVAAGPAGHSLNGGVPNVNQGIGRAVDRILQLPDPQRYADDRVVINVAMLQSGAVYNHKPETGWFSLDVRSLDGARVEAVEAAVREILTAVTAETTIRFTMEPFQITPGGQLPGFRDGPLVTTAEAIARHLGYEPRLGNAGSANLNVPLGQGSPAIGIGGERGGQRGFADEWGDVPQMMRTAKFVALLAATMGMQP
jgi:acetylornithine deacetylase/succinyl-diaminopimelate desuccinylase-like protein/ribosomal protein S18 acetylase RimI-like enzyme